MLHTKVVRNLARNTHLYVRRDRFNLPRVMICFVTCNVVFLPVFPFIMVCALNLDGEDGISVAIASSVVGIYVIEHFACRSTW
jgi:hypothetical protein